MLRWDVELVGVALEHHRIVFALSNDQAPAMCRGVAFLTKNRADTYPSSSVTSASTKSVLSDPP